MQKRFKFMSVLLTFVGAGWVVLDWAVSPLLASAASVIALLLIALNQWAKKIIRGGAGPRNSEERNFDCFLLGSTSAWIQFAKSRQTTRRVVSYAFFRRTLAANFLLLQHKFSYLAEGAEVIITLDCHAPSLKGSNRLRFTELVQFHPITLKSLGINPRRLKLEQTLPLIFHPFYLCGIFRVWILGQRSASPTSAVIVGDLLPQVKEIVEFCLHRDLRPTIAFLHCDSCQFEFAELAEEIQVDPSVVRFLALPSTRSLAELL